MNHRPDRAPWQHLLLGLYPGELEVRSSADGTVVSTMVARSRLMSLQGGPISVTASGEPVGSRLCVLAQVDGIGLVEQDGHQFVLHPGSMVVIDGAHPSRMTSASLFRQVSLLVPRDRFEDHIPVVGTLNGREHPVDRLLFEALAESARTTTDEQRVSVARAAVALLGQSTAIRPPKAIRAGIRVRRACRYIIEHLHEPELCAEQVATAQGVSRRWLDQAFRGVGTTVAARIHEHRLLEAARLLDDPRLSILDVAMAVGFPSGSSLSHAFRKRFGASPTGWRITRLGSKSTSALET
ncbi:MAG: AraC family transcriptional regulator [Myxococcota bacterium]